MPTSLRFGADQLLRTPARWRGWRRVALVTNDAARLAATPAVRTRVALRQAGVPLVRLFGPEHGLGASAADGASVHDGTDPLTQLPVVSLYGERMRPRPEHLDGLDAVLFDIPDVGARFYTYAWTLWHVLHACAEAQVPLVVLDRPNPLGGVLDAAEGPVMAASCRSFIGEDDIPIRHALTLGELARLWQREHAPQARLDVIACEGWDPTLAWPATGLPWVPTSPAMPSFDSAIWYPGTCLFEATNVSVARGTDAPFSRIGAPWLDAAAVAAHFTARVTAHVTALECTRGVTVTPCAFVPGGGPYAGEACHGLRLTLAPEATAPALVARAVRPVALGLHLLAAISARHPHAFAWARYPTAANPTGDGHLDRLLGRPDAAAAVAAWAVAPPDGTVEQWTRVPDWPGRVAPVLLYPRG